MRWYEKLLKSRLLYYTKDAITEHDITISIGAAIDERYGDRLAIETVPGIYEDTEEFNEACEEELTKPIDGLYNLLVLPWKEGVRFSHVLSGFIAGIEQGIPHSEQGILVDVEEAV